jgi:hypothetical protein
MSNIKVSVWEKGNEAATTTTIASVPYKTEPHKIHSIDADTAAQTLTVTGGNWIEKIKAVGSITEYVVLDELLDMDGNSLVSGTGNLTLDESDEITGPFSSVTVAATGDQPTAGAGGSITLLVWEYING